MSKLTLSVWNKWSHIILLQVLITPCTSWRLILPRLEVFHMFFKSVMHLPHSNRRLLTITTANSFRRRLQRIAIKRRQGITVALIIAVKLSSRTIHHYTPLSWTMIRALSAMKMTSNRDKRLLKDKMRSKVVSSIRYRSTLMTKDWQINMFSYTT